LILITKTDLLPHFDYDIEKEKETARKLKPNVDILEVSTKDKESVQKVINWIKFKMELR
jgi:hydrogenase nickel incorporation protein HypB